MDCYKVLGIEPTRDIKLIKKAYSKLLPVYNPETDPAGFQVLRAAYEEAISRISDNNSDTAVTSVDSFMKKFEENYNDYRKRIDVSSWKTLLESDVCYNIETGKEVNFKVLRFIMEHYFFPYEVWNVLNDYFSWSTQKEKLYSQFPKNFIDFVVNRVKNRNPFRFECLVGCKEGRQEQFIDEYYKACTALDEYNLYGANASINICKEICPSHPDLLILTARYLMVNGKLEDADALLTSVIRKNTKDVFAHVFKGHLLYRIGKYADAYEEYKKAFDLYPESTEVLFSLAKCCTSLEKYEEAIQYLNSLSSVSEYNREGAVLLVSAQNFWLDHLLKMIEEEPENLDLKYKLARIYFSTRRVDEAYDLLSSLEQNNQLNGEMYSLLCNILIYQDKDQLAYSTCCKALSLFPDSDELHADKALILDELGDYEGSVKSYETAIRLKSDVATYYNNMAYSLNRLKRHSEALESAERAIMLSPQMANAYKNKAEALLGLQLFEECFEACEEALNYYPYLVDAHVIKMKLFARANQFDEAMIAFSRAADLGINSSKLLVEKANVLRLTKRFDESIELCGQIIESDADNYDAYYCKGMCLYGKGSFEEAYDCFDTAISHNNNVENSYYFKILCLLNTSKHKEALIEIDKAIEVNSRITDRFHDLKGDVLFEESKFEEALAEYKKAIDKNPYYAPYYYAAGKAAANLQRHDEAIKYFDVTIEKDSSILDVYIDKSHSLYQLGKYKECADQCDIVLQTDPNYLLAYQNKAWAVFTMGSLDEAEKLCNNGLKIDGNHLNLLKLKLDIYMKKEMVKEALVVTDRILELVPDDKYVTQTREDLIKRSRAKSGILGKLFGN